MTLDLSQQTVLIVEDSDDDFEATERALKKHGNLVNPIARCEDGADAIDYLFHRGKYANPASAPRPGLILLDLNMPGKDGWAVLREVKKSKELASIPIIILTTSSDAKDIEESYAIGASTYVVKPVNLERFVEAIQRLKEYWFEIAVLPKDRSIHQDRANENAA